MSKRRWEIIFHGIDYTQKDPDDYNPWGISYCGLWETDVDFAVAPVGGAHPVTCKNCLRVLATRATEPVDGGNDG